VGTHQYEGLHLFLASRKGAPVGTALAVRHETGVVVSSVSVLEPERRQGVGAMLTAVAVNVDTASPATLSASRAGFGLYRKLGFRKIGSPLHWIPQAHPAGVY
jgi:GNAT superfamily N-acetyltransferase